MTRWLLLVVVLMLALLPCRLEAATTQDIQIRAAGYVCEAPGGFALYYVSDYEVGISWAKGLGANNTMVRAAYGRLPESRTDGYLVYYGNGTYCNDTAVNFEETASQIYYRAWSQSAAGAWEEIGISDWIEGIGMKIIAFIVLALGLLIASYVFKKQALMIASGLSWVGFAFYMRLESTAVGWTGFDINALFFWLGTAMAIFCFLEAFLLDRGIRADREADEAANVKDSVDTRLDELQHRRDQINRIRRRTLR